MNMEQEELENLSIRQAFEWVRTGHWKLRTFNEWVKAQGAKEYQTGYKKSSWDNKIV